MHLSISSIYPSTHPSSIFCPSNPLIQRMKLTALRNEPVIRHPWYSLDIFNKIKIYIQNNPKCPMFFWNNLTNSLGIQSPCQMMSKGCTITSETQEYLGSITILRRWARIPRDWHCYLKFQGSKAPQGSPTTGRERLGIQREVFDFGPFFKDVFRPVDPCGKISIHSP